MSHMKHVLVLLVLAAAVRPAAAQADLVERTLAATRADEAAGLYLNPVTPSIDGLSQTAISDSIRVRFHADLRPDLLREALRYLESNGARRVTERTLRRPDAIRTATIAYGSGFGIAVPKKGDLADSTLSVRYVAATRREEATLTLFRRIIQAGAEVAPDVIAQEVRPGETVETMTDRLIGEARTSLAPVLLATVRLQLAGVPTVDVEEAIAAEQTDALRYVRAMAAEGTARAVGAAFAELALAEQEGMETETIPVPPPKPR